MTDQITLYLLILLIIGVFTMIWLLMRKKASGNNEEKLITMLERLTQLSDQNKELRKTMDNKLSETHKAAQSITEQTQKAMSSMYAQSQKTVQEVTQKLTKLDETNKQVVNFSSQLQNLQDILKNPKQRGVLGEYYLEETLKNVLPPNSYQMQYPFKDGSIVDAVVFVKEKIIPIDSKFSLENYEKILNCKEAEGRKKLEQQFKQDLKLRIDETAKYVKPNEKTMDFAFMFIPSEAIYYDLLVNKVGSVKVNARDLIEYAFRDKKVIIVSPTSFLAYLQTVLQGLRALQIEESAKEIKIGVEKLGRHIGSYEEFLKKMGVSLSTTVNHYTNAYKEFKKVDKDIVRITGGEAKIEPMVIDKPKIDD